MDAGEGRRRYTDPLNDLLAVQGDQMPSEDQKRFISYELGLLTIKAALSTRDKEFTIYNKSIKSHQRKPVKKAIREVLDGIEKKYTPMISAEDHVKYISETANSLSEKVGKYLKDNRFRVGIAQKLINMHLKYLWCSNVIGEPPHCPIDGIIRDKVRQNDANFDYDWIKNDSIEEYKTAVTALETVANKQNRSVAQWELHEFRRRDDT